MCDNHSIAPETLHKDYIAKYVIPADKPVMNGESSFYTTGFGFKYFKTNCTSQSGGGESYNNGLVNNCHLAYNEFAKGVKEVNSHLFKIHAQK